MKYSLLFLILTVSYVSCRTKSVYDKETYTDFPEIIHLKCRDIKLEDSIYFSYPELYVQDSICCIFDQNASINKNFHIFSFPQFKYKHSLVDIGRGPNEIMNTTKLKLIQNYLYVQDNTNKRILGFSVNDTSGIPQKKYDLQEYILDFTFIGDSLLAIVPYDKSNYRVKLYNQENRCIDSLLPYPETQLHYTNLKQEDIWASIICYDTLHSNLIVATINGEVIDVINPFTHEHQVIVGPHQKPCLDHKKRTVSLPGKIHGFSRIFTDGDNIYGIFSGVSMEDIIWQEADVDYKIYQYTSQGKPLKIYHFDRPVISCYFDHQNKKIYFTDRLSEGMISESNL